jgi:hypothetical protein
MSAPGGGAGQAGLAEEFRALADAALDRLQPWVEQLCQAHAAPSGDESRVVPAACAVCPVCAVIAALRGERSELGTRLAEHAGALLAALRAALHEGQPDGQPARGPGERPPSDERRAQPIRVDRADAPPGPAGGGGPSGAC